MRTAKHDRLDGHVHTWTKQNTQKALHPFALQFAGFHAFHQPRTGHGKRVLAIPFHQRPKFRLRERYAGGEHHHAAFAGAKGRRA